MLTRDVSAHLDIDVTAATTLEFQIAVAEHPGVQLEESLSFRLDGAPVQAREVRGAHGTRIHVLGAGVGSLRADYSATLRGRAVPAPVTDYDTSVYLRPSRYAEADKFFGFAAAEFGDLADTAASGASEKLLENVASWVGARLSYVPGSSDPIDGAVDTLLAGAGVCRDYSHLVVAMLRALGVPARLVAVYAPGCEPMDFHAVAEALVGGVWRVVDATCLAPRSTLVRIATGRDAADTAFLDNHGGAVTLGDTTVTAVVDGPLPADDLSEPVSIS
ncbi:transglutaminase family protein [Rhodococcus triatomae]|uniref:Transglutaminase-like superfamily protein n=1 Tax=Rhodococcus triatomae TaxID=300028 RepID=A0A1G8KET0_9NOCA|nr:transglutaminase family protein [Rhodococcus triatomae]QNG18905.1 transglutaminase family protein [Rhodococcus triatomae]QNG25183.1 transglutaminase family protein [Rhodococcus triatomae]SDI41919.1 Transglutaminase-like superfamily protein [Rhodococcus triatomae]